MYPLVRETEPVELMMTLFELVVMFPEASVRIPLIVMLPLSATPLVLLIFRPPNVLLPVPWLAAPANSTVRLARVLFVIGY